MRRSRGDGGFQEEKIILVWLFPVGLESFCSMCSGLSLGSIYPERRETLVKIFSMITGLKSKVHLMLS